MEEIKGGLGQIPQNISNLTVSELKDLIKECLREYEQEEKQKPLWVKQFSDTDYKALWVKPPTTTGGIV